MGRGVSLQRNLREEGTGNELILVRVFVVIDGSTGGSGIASFYCGGSNQSRHSGATRFVATTSTITVVVTITT